MLRRTVLAIAALAGFALATPAMPSLAQQGPPAMPNPTSSGYAPVNGVELYYATYGKGEPLVLLHGGLMTIDGFSNIIPILAETHEVIAVELQGHGHTGPFERPMSFENMAADVAGLIRHLGHARADVMGYSMGGGVALRLALDHPELVRRVILTSTPFAFSGWHDYNANGMRGMNESLAEPMKATPLYQMFAAVNPDPEANWSKLIAGMGSFIGKDYDWSAEIGTLKAPTMLVAGDWDAVRTSHTAKFFELLGGGLQDAGWDGANMNQNRLAIIPGETHYTIGNSPRLAETVLGFLDAN